MRALLLAAALIAASPGPPGAAAEPQNRCRAFDIRAPQGEILCIPTSEGPRLARCGKVLNVASWTFLEGACPAPSEPSPSGDRDQPASSQPN